MVSSFAFAVVLATAFRVFVVFAGLIDMLTRRSRKIEWDLSMKLALPEPFLVAAVLAWMIWTDPIVTSTATMRVGVTAGGLLGVASVALFVWSFLTYRTVGTGHYVDDNHHVVVKGPYRWVRHPFYLSAFLCWSGVAVATQSLWIGIVFLGYVIPAYWFYAYSEEQMMCRELGDDYRTYRDRVPMFIPRLSTI